MISEAEFRKKFPANKYTQLTVVREGKDDPSIGQEVVVLEEKPVSRLAWLVLGGAAAALGFWAFRRWGPKEPPQQIVMMPGAAPADEGNEVLSALLGED